MDIEKVPRTDRAPSPPVHEEYTRLVRRYRELGWPSSAAEQRERDQLNKQLMRLYLQLNPDAPYREWDDFDAVSRGHRKQRV